MDWVHAHLALNHIPVLGSVFTFLLLSVSLKAGNPHLLRLSLLWFSVLTAITIPIKFTGDFAYEQSRNLDWMEHEIAERHEQSADQATTAMFLLGIFAAIGVIITRHERPLPKSLLVIIVLMSVLTMTLMARSANLGGQIRHTEIR